MRITETFALLPGGLLYHPRHISCAAIHFPVSTAAGVTSATSAPILTAPLGSTRGARRYYNASMGRFTQQGLLRQYEFEANRYISTDCDTEVCAMVSSIGLIVIMALLATVMSVAVVARYGLVMRFFAAITALVVFLTFVVLFWAADMLTSRWVLFGAAMGGMAYGVWLISRRWLERVAEQAGYQARW